MICSTWLLIGLLLLCCVQPAQLCGRRRRRPPPNHPPRFVEECGLNIVKDADFGKAGATVTWPPAKHHAWDPNRNPFRVELVTSKGSGSYFSGKITDGTQVIYKATDCKGAAGYCHFRVYVTVRYCQAVPPVTYGRLQCTGEESNVYGSKCKTVCYPGYQVTGTETVQCQSNGRWSASFPTCESVSCGSPGSLQNGYVVCYAGHQYPAVCGIRCNTGYGYQGGESFIRCRKNGAWDPLGYCRDNQPPTFPNDCPRDLTLKSGPLGANVTVTWADPVALDNSGRKPVLTSTPARGASLGPGSHMVTVTATDAASNKHSCYFRVDIEPRTCAPLQVLRGSLSCSSGYLLGSQCSLTCLKGFRVKGSNTLTCQANGQGQEQWSPSGVSCDAVQCPVPQLTNGIVTCDGGRTYEENCKPKCDEGFKYQGQSYIQCTENGTWSTLGSCQDVEPPKFLNGCPPSINSFAAELGQTTEVRWTIPDVKDNSGTVQLSSDHQPKSVFPIGVTTVTYNATDMAGNSRLCSFTVTLTTLVCKPPDFEANKTRKVMTHNCSDGYVYGASCSLNCSYGYPLVGPSNIVCKRNDHTYPPTMFWEWPGPSTIQPKCSESTCPDLKPPYNGALACSTGNFGWDCLMSCQDPYDVPGTAGNLGTGHFYCPNSKGYWIPKTVPSCSVTRTPNQARLQGDLFYYSDSCNVSKDELRQKFITRMTQHDILKDACVNVPTCKVDNVQVHCGARRTKRAAASDIHMAKGDHPHAVYRRQTANSAYYVLVGYQVEIDLTQNDSWTGKDMHKVVEGVKQTLFTKLKEEVQNGSFNLDGLYLDPNKAVSALTKKVDCPPGTVARIHTDRFTCVGCSEGYFQSSASGQCQTCPVGSYSDIDNATQCTACAPGFSTVTTGADRSSDCIGQCRAGQMSPTGFVPCQPCPAGQYQPGAGATRCVNCPVNTWTVQAGTSSGQDCVEANLVLSNSSVSVKVRGGNWTTVTASLRVAFPDRNSSVTISLRSALNDSLVATTLLSASTVVNELKESKQRRFHHLGLIVTSAGVSQQSPQPLTVLSVSQPLSDLTSLTLHTQDTHVMLASLAVYEGILTPQQVETLTKFCTVDVTKNLLSWSPDPTTVRLPSQCDAEDKCSPNPCGVNGVCLFRLNGYECQCQNGWSGTRCQVAPDPCRDHGCQNGGSCVSGVQNYNCTCSTQYTGEYCELEKVDGGWTEWTPWTQCGCGTRQRRQRQCSNPSPHNGGHNCSGEESEGRNCSASICQAGAKGQWGGWGGWSTCSVQCEGGQSTRHRACQPVNGTGQAVCPGAAQDVQACNTSPCPVDGGWSDWSAWGQCSVTCDQGRHSRHRECSRPVPAHGGHNCTGNHTDTNTCLTSKCPACDVLDRPPGGEWKCREVSQSPYLKECTFTCLPHFALVNAPSRPSRCGQSTGYLWDHQLKKDSHLGSSLQSMLPTCSPAHILSNAAYSTKADMNTDCDPQKAALVKNGIRDNVDQSVECRQQNLCSATVSTECVTSRKRSTPSLRIIVTANLTLNFTASDVHSNATSWTIYQSLMSVVNRSVPDNVTLQSLLTVRLPGSQVVTPDLTSLVSAVNGTCPAGMIPDGVVCAECPPGTKEEDGQCEQCPVGFYQDRFAASSCQQCPSGLTWDMPGATSPLLCIFKLEDVVSTTASTNAPLTTAPPQAPEEEALDVGLLVGLLMGSLVVIVIVLVIVLYTCFKPMSNQQRTSRPGSLLSINRIYPIAESPAPSATAYLTPFHQNRVPPTYEQAIEAGAAPLCQTLTTSFMYQEKVTALGDDTMQSGGLAPAKD